MDPSCMGSGGMQSYNESLSPTICRFVVQGQSFATTTATLQKRRGSWFEQVAMHTTKNLSSSSSNCSCSSSFSSSSSESSSSSSSCSSSSSSSSSGSSDSNNFLFDEQGRIVVNRNPEYFGVLLNYLRDEFEDFEDYAELELQALELEFGYFGLNFPYKKLVSAASFSCPSSSSSSCSCSSLSSSSLPTSTASWMSLLSSSSFSSNSIAPSLPSLSDPLSSSSSSSETASSSGHVPGHDQNPDDFLSMSLPFLPSPLPSPLPSLVPSPLPSPLAALSSRSLSISRPPLPAPPLSSSPLSSPNLSSSNRASFVSGKGATSFSSSFERYSKHVSAKRDLELKKSEDQIASRVKKTSLQKPVKEKKEKAPKVPASEDVKQVASNQKTSGKKPRQPSKKTLSQAEIKEDAGVPFTELSQQEHQDTLSSSATAGATDSSTALGNEAVPAKRIRKAKDWASEWDTTSQKKPRASRIKATSTKG